MASKYRIKDKNGRYYGEFSDLEYAKNTASKLAQTEFGKEFMVEKMITKVIERYCYGNFKD